MQAHGLAPGQEPADPRRVIVALQNLAAIEQLVSTTPGGWYPREDEPAGEQLRNLAIAGVIELHPFEIPGSRGVRHYSPTFTTLGALTVFGVLGVARTQSAATTAPATGER